MEKNELICVNGVQYQNVRLLGKGKGGYSYLVTSGGKEFVLKQIHHEPCEYYSFGDKITSELNDYEKLREVGIPMPDMVFIDMEKEIIIKEYVDGETVFDLVRDGKMKQEYIVQVKKMCDLLYPAGLNIDYFPTNFIVSADNIYYIDYECNSYMEEWNFENWGIRYWSKTTEFMEYFRTHSV